MSDSPLIEFLEPDFVFENEGGYLVQLFREGYRQVNVVSSKKGSQRGGHYHAINRELFYVVSGRFNLKLSRGDTCEDYELYKGDMFVIPSHVAHFFTYLEDSLLVAAYDNGVELPDFKKDIISVS